jgi:hypothetical protein
MKRVFTSIIAAVFMLSAISTSALAKDQTTLKPGITPDSILYPIDRLVENVQLKLTGDSAKKVAMLIKISSERFDEAEKMAEKKKDEKSVKALEDGQKSIEEAEDVVAKNDDKKDEKLEKAEKALTDYTKKSVERLRELADREDMPEHAQLVLKRVAAMQQMNHLKKLIKRAEKNGANTTSLKPLEDALKDANGAYEIAQDELAKYKANSKEQGDDSEKNAPPKDKDEKNNKGQSKDKENKGQPKDKGNNN